MLQTYEQPFQQLLQESHFFADFLRLFVPDEAAHLRLDNVQPGKEIVTDTLPGEQRTAGVVAQVLTWQGQHHVVLVHIEAQKKRAAVFPQRMYTSYTRLWLRYHEPILPIALLLYPDGEGVSLATHRLETVGRAYVTFRYWQISLPRLDAQAYLATSFPLAAGLAARMRQAGRGRAGKVALYAACVGRIAQALHAQDVNEEQAYLLMDVVGTCLNVRAEERHRVVAEAREKGVPTVATLEQAWADRLRAEGKAEGKRESLRTIIHSRFGRIPADLEQHIAEADLTTLDTLTTQALHAQSLFHLMLRLS